MKNEFELEVQRALLNHPAIKQRHGNAIYWALVFLFAAFVIIIWSTM